MAPLEPVAPSLTGVDPAAFRTAVGAFATGVCVVTTRVGGLDHAMTANSFASVSLDPAMVLFCVSRQSRFHRAVLDAGEWVVNILAEPAEAAARWLATPGRPLLGQLDRVPHRAGPGTGLPVLAQALAALECRTAAVHPAGDHSIVLGEVTGVLLSDEDLSPLLYHRRQYRVLPRAVDVASVSSQS